MALLAMPPTPQVLEWAILAVLVAAAYLLARGVVNGLYSAGVSAGKFRRLRRRAYYLEERQAILKALALKKEIDADTATSRLASLVWEFLADPEIWR